jgi:ectoine hydroxylase-related dioxygenase (phytanoyl-CoA dioxygenase family)
MRDSTADIEDAALLRARIEEEGYLLLRGVLDPKRVNSVRRAVVEVLHAAGWIDGPPLLMRARSTIRPVREGDDAYFEVYDEVQRLEAFHSLAHDDDLLAVVRRVVGDTAFPHPLKVARLVFPGNYEASTPPHQDYLNNQGTPSLTAAWIPLGDCPRELGSLAVLEGSNHDGVLPLDFHLGAGNRRAVLPDHFGKLRWVTADVAAGDVVLFPSLTVHAALNNATELFMRLSADFRYQQEGEALTELVLQPHFGRLTWDQVYEGWSSDRFQRYWEGLRYEVVPFDRSEYELSEPRSEDVSAWLRYEQALDRRQRLRGRQLPADPPAD